MNSIAARLLRLAPRAGFASSSSLVGLQNRWKSRYSTFNFGNDPEVKKGNGDALIEDDGDDDIFSNKSEVGEVAPQGVDPKRGWGYRGVHKYCGTYEVITPWLTRGAKVDVVEVQSPSAIICGKIGQAPVQKILRNGKTVTIFTVGTGGMFDQRTLGNNDLPKPAQWHRIAVHNDALGSYAVQQLVKNSSVYVEGDIEIRVYNDSINGDVKNIPEICVRRDGRIRLIKSGESISNFSFDDLREGLA